MNQLNWLILSEMLLPWTIITIGSLISPRLARPDLFFAVTVNPALRQSPDGRQILRRYERFVIAFAIATLLLIALAWLAAANPIITLAGPQIIQLTGAFAAFLIGRKRVRAFHVEPSSEREVSLAPRKISMPGGMLVQAGPFLILVAFGFFLWLRWDNLPEQFPIHWGADGKPNGWAHKNLASVFGIGAIGVLTCSLFAVLCYALLHGVRSIHSIGAKAEREARSLRAISFLLLAVEYWIAVLMGCVGLLPFHPDLMPAALAPVLIGETILIGAIFLIAFRYGQSGWKLATPGVHEPLPASAAPVGDRTPDHCWKFGVFYFNRNDPATFVEKRFGYGWTVNFANPRAIIILVSLLFLSGAGIIIGLLAAR